MDVRNSSTTPTIAIVGAGPGGRTCARVLQLAGIPVTVHDADASLDARDQGGTLDLHADSGQIAIEDARLVDEFAALARPEGQSKRMVAPDGTVLMEHIAAPDDDAAPEIDRKQLRAMLAASLEPGTIRWGSRVESVSPAADGRATVVHTDGTTTTADVVIGADGAWSRVRAAFSDALPSYSGVSFVEVIFTDVERRHPEIAALVGDGHLWANGDGRTIILQRNSGDVVRGYLGLRAPLDWLARAGLGVADGRGGVVDANGVQGIDQDRVRRVLHDRFDDFAPALRRVIDENESSFANRPIFGLRTPFRWTHTPGTTLIGDAAHVMAPFGGNGVNLAMLDGAELARRIADAVRNGSDVDDALRAHEQTMMDRSNPIGAGANAAIVEHFAAGGPDMDGIPDFDEESARWKDQAADYRAARAAAER